MSDTTKPLTTEEVDYLKYGNTGLKVKDLDQMKDLIMGISTSNYIAMIIAGIKLLMLAAYFFVRDKALKEEILLAKNKQLQDQANHDAGQVETQAPEVETKAPEV